ncbi:hypothetical protein F5883DRAFT_431732 [Diaporthe sp. PMI_573]|nr:hypothetical protein F5883DRAFT_431732 [Diaporthaceae sp. PMI_573]
MHYGSVLDVLVQHHPEYTSLIWGAMKILFGESRFLINVVAAPCQISESLPTAESAIMLYPTPELVNSVSMLYAHNICFLVRAWNFYPKSKFIHAIHPVTRPATLRYDDLIKSIQRDAESVRRLFTINSQ